MRMPRPASDFSVYLVVGPVVLYLLFAAIALVDVFFFRSALFLMLPETAQAVVRVLLSPIAYLLARLAWLP